MIIKWEVGIDKEPADPGLIVSSTPFVSDNVINITNPRFSKSDIKELKWLHTVHRSDIAQDNYPDLPLADHTSNGFVNNPGLLKENEFYPLDPMNCWTHDPESDPKLAYCSIILHEEDDPMLYKIVKHGMNHIQKLYQYETQRGPSSLARNSLIDSTHASDLVINWNQELNNEEFFDLGDLTIIACGEIAHIKGQSHMKDIENVEVYVCKLNLKYNEEHFIRLLQVEDILFSGLQWEFFAHDLRLGPYSSLDITKRFKRRATPYSLDYNLLWLDREIFVDLLQFRSLIIGKNGVDRFSESQEKSDDTLRLLGSMTECETRSDLDPVPSGKDEDFYMSDTEISRIFGLDVSTKSSLSVDDSCYSRRVSRTETQQTTPEKTYLHNDGMTNTCNNTR
ncbi:uncharacterized protein KLLA0_F23331g [Kluyveromyces lactis]|uniref:KLLA0F23331p n=1 Tax=Kluyveromyces lactis (strain ATCC 8585 / CBS 2359 / DSM 70799 / NBRC 1267 / NRRL Y-1140 / WM37) TaxID=284590 RepID=Q6CIX0_KLULA|nr:uncharacterized protein KLLA0_F23331g [Kluyveromyces lactis]CAG98827.1 KLLA0F23331p [Kluyveromyces lactis]|eukprot:XP_456119.1 uncharacterized protein KLLA0_F23331g [Kluyveromyces lactis]